MTVPDRFAAPDAAAPRTDLPFLSRRHRDRPSAQAVTPVADFLAGRGPRPEHHARTDARTDARTHARTHARSGAGPDTHGEPRAAATPSATPPPDAPPPAADTSLDLFEPARPEPENGPPAAAAPDPGLGTSLGPVRRMRAREQVLLGVHRPSVRLTRVQSGIGRVEVEAVCSPDVGDLCLGAAVELQPDPGVDGPTRQTIVQRVDGIRFAPDSRHAVVLAGRDDYEHVQIDLRRTRQLRRLSVYVFSETRQTLTWGGTLVITTFGAGRIELPLEALHPGRTAVLASIYNVDGEFVVRAEMETIDGDVREAVRAYGYDRITWRDDRHPID